MKKHEKKNTIESYTNFMLGKEIILDNNSQFMLISDPRQKGIKIQRHLFLPEKKHPAKIQRHKVDFNKAKNKKFQPNELGGYFLEMITNRNFENKQ